MGSLFGLGGLGVRVIRRRRSLWENRRPSTLRRTLASAHTHPRCFRKLVGLAVGLTTPGCKDGRCVTSPRAIGGLTYDAETLNEIPGAYIATARSPRDSNLRWDRCHLLLCKGAFIYGAGCVCGRTDGIVVCYGRPRTPSHVDAASGGLKS